MKPIEYKNKIYKFTNLKTVNGVEYVLYKHSDVKYKLVEGKPIVDKITRKAIVYIDGKLKVVKGDLKEYWNSIK